MIVLIVGGYNCCAHDLGHETAVSQHSVNGSTKWTKFCVAQCKIYPTQCKRGLNLCSLY